MGGGENSDFLTLVIRATDVFSGYQFHPSLGLSVVPRLADSCEGRWGCVLLDFLRPPTVYRYVRAGGKMRGCGKLGKLCREGCYGMEIVEVCRFGG